MSTNIDHVETHIVNPKNPPRMKLEVLERFREEHECELAECSFLEYGRGTNGNGIAKPDAEGYVALPELWWCGESSGNTVEVFEQALAHVEGSADVFLHWENGYIQGYQLRDGEVTDCEVEMTMKPKRKLKR